MHTGIIAKRRNGHAARRQDSSDFRGRATALTFAREGAKVLCADRYLASAEETAAMIREKGGTAEAVATDVTDEVAVKAAIQACTDRWGRLDILG